MLVIAGLPVITPGLEPFTAVSAIEMDIVPEEMKFGVRDLAEPVRAGIVILKVGVTDFELVDDPVGVGEGTGAEVGTV
jgi:hypothetical protein